MRTIPIAIALLCFAVALPADAATRSSKKQPWGAIAFNSKTSAFGYAVDRDSKRTAEAEASRQCGADCDVIHSFRNNCGAIANDARRFFWATGATRAIAEQQALGKCTGGACKIAVWACTSEK